MSIFDIIVLLILLFFAFRGLISGMITQIVSVGSYIVCWVISSRFYFLVSPFIPLENPWNNIGAMIILFVVTMILIRFVHSVIKKLIEKYRLVKYDRILGFILGGVKGLLICMVITFFSVMLTEKSKQIVLDSKFGIVISKIIARVGYFIPQDSCKMLKTQIELFDGQILNKQENPNLSESPSSLDKVLENVKDIRDKIENSIETNKKAVSLFDGIYKWWNNKSTESESESETKTETKTESEIKSENNKTNETNNEIDTNDSGKLSLDSNLAELEKQTREQETAPHLESVFKTGNEIVQEKSSQVLSQESKSEQELKLEPVTNQVLLDTDFEQLMIPQERGLFRLSRSPMQPAELIRSQTVPNNKSAIKLFGQ
ncbi:MAG: CvpA family protein [Planctomycetaceae bacterium]|jgi:membrane protein required for colicin V production|nr:CvpA family protein [Planctomycetaceae bacterium]